MKTWAGYAEENKEYNGRAYVYTPVLPESAEKFEIAEIELPEIYVLVGRWDWRRWRWENV